MRNALQIGYARLRGIRFAGDSQCTVASEGLGTYDVLGMIIDRRFATVNGVRFI